uniref:Uncharacterized protein n=1 Tax=Trichogramma kaykai TaxID=54128 RepID=A0ABD2X8F5_9HYME
MYRTIIGIVIIDISRNIKIENYEKKKEKQRKALKFVCVPCSQAARVSHPERRHGRVQVVRRGVAVPDSLVPSQVQAARDVELVELGPERPAPGAGSTGPRPRAPPNTDPGAALQVSELQRLLQVAQGLHRPPELEALVGHRERREPRRLDERQEPAENDEPSQWT